MLDPVSCALGEVGVLHSKQLYICLSAVDLGVGDVVMLDEQLLAGPINQVAVVVRWKLRDICLFNQPVRPKDKANLYKVVRVLARIEANPLIVAVVLRESLGCYKIRGTVSAAVAALES